MYVIFYVLYYVVDGQRQSWRKRLRSWRSRRASACFPSSSSLPQSLMPWHSGHFTIQGEGGPHKHIHFESKTLVVDVFWGLKHPV